MLVLLGIYRCVPPRFRFVLRWLAMCLFLLLVMGVFVLFYRVLQSVKYNHGHSIFHPHSHQPLSSDSVVFRPIVSISPKEVL